MLETEIKELRKAIEALTAALEKNPVSATEAPAPEAPVEPEPAVEKEVPKNQDEVPKNQDELTFEMLKDATLKASRAGYKDAIRKKLNEMGLSKIQDLEARVSGPEDFYKWLKELMQ